MLDNAEAIPTDIFSHILSFINPADELILALGSATLCRRVEESIQVRLEDTIRREFVTETVKMQNARLEKIRRKVKTRLGKTGRMPFRIVAHFVPRDWHATSHRGRDLRCPRVICGLPDGMIASVDDSTDGEACLRIYNPLVLGCWKLVASCFTVGLATRRALSRQAQSFSCKIDDDTIYIILQQGTREWEGAVPVVYKTKILCWRWDGIKVAHQFTKVFENRISMAVSEDGMVYYTELRDPAIHAFSLLYPDSRDHESGYRTAPWSRSSADGFGCAMAIVGDYLLVASSHNPNFLFPRQKENGLYVLLRDTLVECHVFHGITFDWGCTALEASSCGVVATFGSFRGETGLHAMRFNSANGTIDYHSFVRDGMNPVAVCGSIVYALGRGAGNKLHVYDIDSSAVGRRVRSIDIRIYLDPRAVGVTSLEGLVVTKKGLILFLSFYEMHGNLAADEIQLYVGCPGDRVRVCSLEPCNVVHRAYFG